MRNFGVAIVLSLGLIHAPAVAAEKERHVYTSSGPWAMEYADDSCRLIRNFTREEDQITLAFERFAMGTSIRLGLAGEGLRARSSARVAKFRYLPDGVSHTGPLLRSELADGRSSFVVDSAPLIQTATEAAEGKEVNSAKSRADLDSEELAAAARTEAIFFSEGFKDGIELRLGSMAQPIKALQACATDLIKSWGLDPEAVSTMTRGPEPLGNPGSWLTWTDYPEEMLREKRGGHVRFLLILSAEGRVEDCKITVTKPGPFELVVCDSIKERAKFSPALDANGQPMRSYWANSARFTIGR